MLSFQPLPEEESVNIYGFDISELKELEVKLRYHANLVDNVSDAIISTDKELKIRSWNKAAERMYGWKADEVIDLKRSDILKTTFPEGFSREIITTDIFEKGSWEGELIQKTKGGRDITVYAKSIQLMDEAGVVIGEISISYDITERKRAEEKLRESEERLNFALETVNTGAWELDLMSHNSPHRSLEHDRIFGYEQLLPQWTYEMFLNHVIPEDRVMVDAKFNKAITTGSDWSFECRIRRVDGIVRWIWAAGRHQVDATGSTRRIAGIVQDITERKQVEEALRESEGRYRMLFTNMTEGFCLVEVVYSRDGKPDDFRYLEINPTFELFLGVKKEKTLGKTMLKIFPNISPIAIERYKEAALSGQPFTFEIFSPVANKFLEIYVFSPEKGKLALVIRDITERKEAEDKLKDTLNNLDKLVKERTAELENAYNSLKESEEKYRNIVETANEGILITDKESIAIYINDRFANVLGYTPEELIGKSTWNLISEEYKPIVKMNLDKRRQGISNSYELKLIRKDGNPIWTIINAKPLHDDGGRYIGAMSMFTDITAWKEAEEALTKIDTARKQEIHHRIKNNLQVISSLLDLRADKFSGRENIQYSEVLEAFKESQDRVISMALIHEELYKGKEFKGEGFESVGFEILNFSPYIEKLAENLFLTYRLGNNISLNMELEDNLFFNMDTAIPLGIIVNELVTNSLKHAFIGRDKGEIRIQLHREESESTLFTLTVSDNGIGIPENLEIEDLDSLGMQLVITLVDQLDGELELKRNNGTEFNIWFTVTARKNQASTPASK